MRWASFCRIRCLAAALVAAGAMAPHAASATLLGYEPFNYTVGSAVSGQSGGVGWSGPWGQQGATAIPANSNSVAAGSLAGPAGLPTAGNHAFLTGEFGTLQMARSFANVAGADGTSTWFSFLAQRQGETSTNVAGNPYPRGANVGLFDTEAVSQGGTANERFGVGNSSNATEDAWSIIPQGGGGNREGSAANPWSTLAWGVVRVDHIGDATVADSAWLWINPDPLGGEPLKANAVVEILSGDTNSRDFSNVDFVRPFVGNTAGTVGMANHRPFAVLVVDEIRLGTNWDDMRAVPEPSAGLLFALGGLALGALRKRG